MTYRPNLPWSRINEFLLSIEQNVQTKDLCDQAVQSLKQLIPYETAYILYFDDHFQVTDYQVFGVPEKQLQQFLDYYITIDPCRQQTPPDAKTWRLDWNDFRHTEFQTDWGHHAEIAFTSSMYLHRPDQTPGAIVFTTRCGKKGFSDRDYAIWETIQPHLSNYFSTAKRLQLLKEQSAGSAKGLITPAPLIENPREFHSLELIQGHKLLSKREAEVTALLCQRLTVPEIASKLVISPTTVRTYIENIKEKLKVKNRRELLAKLLR